jgi:isoleucyl-tRNA synthetase
VNSLAPLRIATSKILSELAITIDDVVQRMDRYDSFGACQQLNALVDGLSNWYVRRCRNRYWGKETAQESQDKADAYWTLYEVLLTTSKLIAPFVPFLAETIWKTLTEPVRGRVRESVHLCDYPNKNATIDRCDVPLDRHMQVLREIASLGRSARMDSKLKVRQPLSRVEVSLASDEHIEWLREHDAIVREELNVKEIAYNAGNSPFIEYKIQPDLKRLGPRIGKLLPKLKSTLGSTDGAKLLSELQTSGKITLDLDGTELQLDTEDIQVRLQAKAGWTAAQGKQCVVVLSTELTPELIREGYARDLVRLVQDNRKQMQCQFTDRIRIYVVCTNPDLMVAFKENLDYITTETLAVEILFGMPTSNVEMQTFEIGEHTFKLGIEVI